MKTSDPKYRVKEIFYTLQGEGIHSGRASVFCRFAGCNFWSGREQERAAAICNFCDTDFLGTDGPGGGEFDSAAALATAIRNTWKASWPERGALVVFTGGEPTLQLDTELVDAVHSFGFEIAIETNGSHPVPPGVDWITVSPKSLARLVQRTGSELKLVYPQEIDPSALLHLDFKQFIISPKAEPDRQQTAQNVAAAVQYCLDNPRWRLSVQVHKIVGIP